MESTLDELFCCADLRKAVDSFETQVGTPLEILRRDLNYALESGVLDKFLRSEDSKLEE